MHSPIIDILAMERFYLDDSLFWPPRVTIFGATVCFSDFLSTVLLLGCSVLSLLIFLKRQNQNAPGAVPWGLMAVGLFFLAQDELFSFHENFDAWIHELTGMEYTVWTSQIDTLVLVSYMVIAIVSFLRYHGEIRECAPSWRRFLVAGFVVALFSMVCDALSNFHGTIESLFGERAAFALRVLNEIENGCELFAEVLFLRFFWTTLRFVSSESIQAVQREEPL